MASDCSVPFRYVCPSDVVSESDKDTQGALIRAFDKYDLVAFAKYVGNLFRVSHFGVPFLVSASGLRAKLGFVDRAHLFKSVSFGLLFGGDAGSIPLGRFQIVETLRFHIRRLNGRFQALENSNQRVNGPIRSAEQVEAVLRIFPFDKNCQPSFSNNIPDSIPDISNTGTPGRSI